MNILELVFIAVAGFFASSTLSLFLTMIRQLNFSDVSLIQIIGSFFTKSINRFSFLLGGGLYFIFGIFFAFIYTLILKTIPGVAKYSFSYLAGGCFLGIVHGLVFSLFLLIILAENHPIKKYREVGFGGAFFYFLAHVVYGLSFGFFYMVFVTWGFIL